MPSNSNISSAREWTEKLGSSSFLQQSNTKNTILAIADATLDVDMDIPLIIESEQNGKIHKHEIRGGDVFSDPDTAIANWNRMFRTIRGYLEKSPDITKITMVDISHNGEEIVQGKTQDAYIIITLPEYLGNPQKIEKYRIGKIATTEEISTKYPHIPKEALGGIGVEWLKKNPGDFFRSLFGGTLGGGQHNMSATMKEMSLALPAGKHTANIRRDSVQIICAADFTENHLPFTRISLMGKDPKTILRTDAKEGGPISAMEQAAVEAIAHGNVTDVIVTSAEGKVYAAAVEYGKQIHALISNPNIASIKNAKRGAHNSELSELGRMLTSIQKLPIDPEVRAEVASLYNGLHAMSKTSAEYETMLSDLKRTLKKLPNDSHDRAFYEREIENIQTKIQHHEADKRRLIKDCLYIISQHSGLHSDLLITNGAHGMIGLLYAYGHKIIFDIDILPDTEEDTEKFLDRMEQVTDGVIAKDKRNTTGCGDSCMAAWSIAQEEIGKRQRHVFFSTEVALTRISPENYLEAFALIESFWHAVFVKTVSGLMFRTENSNFKGLPKEAFREIIRFVNNKTSIFIQKALKKLIDRGNGYDEKKFKFGYHNYIWKRTDDFISFDSFKAAGEMVEVTEMDILSVMKNIIAYLQDPQAETINMESLIPELGLETEEEIRLFQEKMQEKKKNRRLSDKDTHAIRHIVKKHLIKKKHREIAQGIRGLQRKSL